VLSNHRFDITGTSKSDNASKSNDNNSSSPKEEAPEMSFAMLEGKCYCCGKPNHKSPTCCFNDKIPQEEWAINKSKTKEHSHVNTKSQKSTSTSTNNASQ
jgi:hypothetical protein